jgi:hypothetical protein
MPSARLEAEDFTEPPFFIFQLDRLPGSSLEGDWILAHRQPSLATPTFFYQADQYY